MFIEIYSDGSNGMRRGSFIEGDMPPVGFRQTSNNV